MILTVNIPNGKYISIASEIFKNLYVHFYIIIYSSKSFYLSELYLPIFIYDSPLLSHIFHAKYHLFSYRIFSLIKIIFRSMIMYLNVILILKWPYFIHLFFFYLYILFVCLFISISWVWNQGSSFQLTHLVSCMRTGQSIIPLWGSNTQLCIVVVCPSEIELSFLIRRFPDLFTHLCYGLDSVDLLLVLELIPCFCPMHIETQANLHNSVNIIRKSLITGIVGSTLESDLERD